MSRRQKEKPTMSNDCENCGKCCIETEMIVSEHDIDLIMRKCQDHKRKQEFIFKNKDDLFQLKNIEGYCVFFDKLLKICTIYEFRPQGCRFYPLIYDFHRKKCIFDKDCPRVNLFYQDKQVLKEKCDVLKRFLKEQLKINII